MNAENRNPLTKEQLDLIERFTTAYNAVDHYLREFLRAERSIPFAQLVREYAARYPRWREQENLRMMGDLRNAVVHQRERIYEYLSVPVPSVVENLERIRDQFTRPDCVIPKFQRDVLTFQSKDVLPEVLQSISENDFSQFPIYENERYLGLLTENGITRWLARHSTTVMTLIDLGTVLVKDVLSQEEQRQNCQFISRNSTVLDAENQFVRNTVLEALLISETGKQNEKLTGIITRWDVLKL